MLDFFERYLVYLYRDVPVSVYVLLLLFFITVALIVFYIRGFKKGLRSVFGILTLEYIFLIYVATVLIRSYYEGSGHNFTPLWSYHEIQNGRVDLLVENIMNVLLFAPLGLLLAFSSSRLNWRAPFIIGLGISISIEMIQFLFKTGFSEVDDIIHNTLGCMIGYGLYSLIRFGYRKFFKRRVAVYRFWPQRRPKDAILK